MKQLPVTIFLPAAGLGERLRPVTDYLPKPLIPVLGKPVIEIILDRLTPVCAGEIGINLHYKPEMLRDWARQSGYSGRIRFFPEDPILGTGGALKNAGAFLSGGTFIVHNADILLDIDFTRLVETHLASGNIATLATHRLPRLGNVVIDENDLVLNVENPGDSKPDPNTVARKVAYTGVAVYSPDILSFLPDGVSHATAAWIDASRAGHRVQALDVTGSAWNDIGTPASYAVGVLDTLREQGETVFVSPACRCGNIGIDGYVALEATSAIQDGAQLRNCIVMPGARVSGRHENSIIGPDYVIELEELDMQPSLHASERKTVSLAEPLFAHYFWIGAADAAGRALGIQPAGLQSDAVLIGLGGSDRRYYRVRNNGRTAVLMECRPDDPDYERHLVYTRFFSAHAVPVPALIAADEPNHRALFEDLGDLSLYSYLKLPHDEGQIEDVYRSVLDILVTLHGPVTEHVHACPQLQARIFDYDYLRWETGYFLERFVGGLINIMPADRERLEAEFRRLAHQVDSFPKGVIHRDYQSQNIIIAAGSVPRVIDFQGARMAPAAYDVASILWDPYYRLDDAARERLVAYYIREMNRNSSAFDASAFRNSLLPCRLQRHMQALGAYGFLSGVKGKKYFLHHVPEALRLLQEETAAAGREYPHLHHLVSNLVRHGMKQ